MSDTGGRNDTPITTDGSAEKRIKYGTASWVYGWGSMAQGIAA